MCVWKVSARNRQCRWCCYSEGCEERPKEGLKSPGEYMEAMSKVVGFDASEKTRRERSAIARCMVAYQMKMDGFSHERIAQVIKRHRTTAIWSINAMASMLQVPCCYPEEMKVWKEYQKLIQNIKDYEHQRTITADMVFPLQKSQDA